MLFRRLLERFRGLSAVAHERQRFGPPPYEFGEYECHEVKCGSCPVDSLELDALRKVALSSGARFEYDSEYCVYIAKKLLSNAPEDEGFRHVGSCDGRHRRCAADKLRAKGADVTIYVDKP